MINSFHDFVGGGTSNNIKPYIYVIRYILSKEDYVDELKEYILNYVDEGSDFEDDKSYDSFMKKLKWLAEENEIDEIENMVFSYEGYSDEDDDFNGDDDNFEEKMYNNEYIEDIDIEDLREDVENSNLSDGLKDFLKVDIQFEDLDDDYGDDIDNDRFDDSEESNIIIEEEVIEYEDDEDEMNELKNDNKYNDYMKRPPFNFDDDDVIDVEFDEIKEENISVEKDLNEEKEEENNI